IPAIGWRRNGASVAWSRMATIVRHAVVLLITDDVDCGVETATALADMGCLAHRIDADSAIDRRQHYDAAVTITEHNTAWSADALDRLRSIEFACASLVLLASGGPEDVAESLQRGAADCLVRPVSDPELLEGISGVIESTRRWRARCSRARLLEAERRIEPSTLGSAMARVFEPVVERVTVAAAVPAAAPDDNPE